MKHRVTLEEAKRFIRDATKPARLSEDLSPEERERVEDLLARGPLSRKPIDDRLLRIGWATRYPMLDGSHAVTTPEGSSEDYARWCALRVRS